MLLIADQLSQYGVGVVILILVLREVLPWAAGIVNNKNGQSKGTYDTLAKGCVLRSEFDKHKELVQYKENCAQVQETIKARFDGLTKLTEQRFKSVDAGISDVKSLIKKNGNGK